MENIERTQFVVLTGHLDDQPLPDLIRRLRVQKKSGRLQVEYADAPGSFFFEDGQLVDAQLGALRGVEALYAALALDGASFNFNPLVRPPERNIDRQGQQFIWDLIEAPRREGLAEIKVAGGELDVPAGVAALRQNAPRQLPPAADEMMAPLEQRLTAVEEAIISTSHRFSRERLVYGVIIGFLAGLSLVTTLHVIFDPFRTAPASATGAVVPTPAPVAANGMAAGGEASRESSGVAVNKEQEGGGGAERERDASSQSSNSQSLNSQASSLQTKADETARAEQARQSATVKSTARRARKAGGGSSVPRGEYVVPVLVQVRDGRVTGARVWKSRPGARAYEAVALKMAKERRYPEGFTGGERVNIRVKP